MNPSGFKCWVSVLLMAFLSAAAAQEQPVITTKSLPIGTSGIPYSAALTATGGAAPYTWSIRTGNLPSGLQLNSTDGSISGTPSTLSMTTKGSKPSTFFPFPLIFQVQDSNGLSATANLPIKVENPIVIESTSLPEGTVGVAYSFCLMATGGALAYNGGLWKVIGGRLPERILLTEGPGCRGWLNGTPSKAGEFPVKVQVADFQGRSAQASFVLTIAKEIRHH